MASLTPLSGFPEFLPQEQRAFDSLKAKIEKVFQSFGYQGMETPAVEKMTTLVAKGAAEQEIYSLRRYNEEDYSKPAELGLRFDLTVPLARYVSQHNNALAFPFRRYQIAPVWRGERPQKGRYRQFYQCDIDIIGENDLHLSHDAEALSVLVQALYQLGLPDFRIHLNHKKILLGVIEFLGIAAEQSDEFLRLLDKKQKISAEDFNEQLATFLLDDKISQFYDFCACSGSLESSLDKLEALEIKQELFQQGLSDLRQLLPLLQSFNVAQKITLDVSLARGLSYYTGIVFETFIPEAPQLGSIASGGRYDSLTQHFIQRRQYPGIGLSIGLSRLFSYLVESQKSLQEMGPMAQALIAVQDPLRLADYIALAQQLRQQSCAVEVYLQHKSLGDQYKYAEKKGYRYVITARSSDIDQQTWAVKDIKKQEQKMMALEEIIALIHY